MGAEADFSGYATKAGLKCSDGRTITPDAFKHMDGKLVPLVWQHGHNSVENLLGHALLEARSDGVYAYGYFNETKAGQNAKIAVAHKDLTALSIYANQLLEKSKQVLHGMIKEVSLVLAGANPGALIDFVAVQHDGGEIEQLEDEAIIHTGLPLENMPGPQGNDMHGTLQDVYDSMDPEQKDCLHYMVAQALEAQAAAVTHSDGEKPAEEDDTKSGEAGNGNANDATTEGDLEHKEGSTEVTKRNVFENGSGDADGTDQKTVLSHADIQAIFSEAKKQGNTLKSAVQDYALAHGIDSIETLFPELKNTGGTPQFLARRMEWVDGVLNATSKTPFSRVKTLVADITLDEARAKGYIKGNLKKEEFFSVSRRSTTPTTVYKKQKLDRDDVIDITDFDVVSWMKEEMRVMLREELATAILISDGRAVDDEDKIKDPAGATDGAGIRSILNDHELYVTTEYVNIDDASSSYVEVVDGIVRAMRYYKGTGTPTFYTTLPTLTAMLLTKDGFGRRMWRTSAELAAEMMVKEIVTVETIERLTDGTLGIIVNLVDYNIGADRGGEVNMFDFFDIDFNQLKYLIETRVSGGLTKIKSAVVVKKTTGTNVLVVPAMPAFDEVTGALTITNQTGVVYKHGATTINAAGSPYTVAVGTPWTVEATPASGYYFENGPVDWTFVTEA
jgi:hypothetical protein